eukprot:4273861-Amphidinium_carterae.2
MVLSYLLDSCRSEQSDRNAVTSSHRFDSMILQSVETMPTMVNTDVITAQVFLPCMLGPEDVNYLLATRTISVFIDTFPQILKDSCDGLVTAKSRQVLTILGYLIVDMVILAPRTQYSQTI